MVLIFIDIREISVYLHTNNQLKTGMKRYLKVLLVCLCTITMVGCTETQDGIENAIIGNTWAGKVGMKTTYGEDLYSVFFFNAQGFGTETQYVQDGNGIYAEFQFQWEWEDSTRPNLILNYGKLGISYMDNLSLIGNTLTGSFLLDEYSDGIPFILIGQ